ncbi:MAG TPA: OmpA family protein, partial [Paenibacillus sp.]|nr:OmpA family protein [Paenibacillus sp.]
AQLKPESRELAVTISELLEQYPNYEVVVSGHTDNVPIKTSQFPSNFHLSAERALSFMAVLLENPGVGQERFSSVGYSEYKPVASNDTAEGRAQNRRVEVSIVRNVQ